MAEVLSEVIQGWPRYFWRYFSGGRSTFGGTLGVEWVEWEWNGVDGRKKLVF